MRRKSTKNYYFDANMENHNNLIKMLQHIKNIMKQLPNQSLEHYEQEEIK